MPAPVLATTLSSTQLIALWVQLEDAYQGENGFGGDTAEIYAYTLLDHSPLVEKGRETSMGREAAEERAQQAAEALEAVLYHFAAVRQCEIEVDGEELCEVEPFDHRVHVRVIP